MTSVVEGDRQARSHSASDAGAVRRAAPAARTPLALGALAVVSAVVTVASASSVAFYYDDYWNLWVARSLPWGWSLLGRPVFGHVTPGANALMGFVAGTGSGGYRWAVLELAVFAALLPVGAFAASRSLGARRGPALAAALVVVAGAGWASASTWWSAGLNLYPSALAGMAVVVATRAMVAGRSGAAGAAAAALALGLCFSEGAIVFLVFVAVLAASDADGSFRMRLGGLWRDRRSWAVVCSPILGLVVVRASAAGPVESSPHPSPIDLVLFPFVFLAKGFVPLVFGLFPGRLELAGSVLLTIVVALSLLIGLVASSGIWGSKRFRAAAIALLLTVVARGAMVAWNRLAVLGWDAAVELRYVADLAWLVPVIVAAHVPPATASGVRGRHVLAGALALVVVGSTAGQLWLVEHAPAAEARSYRDQLGDAAAALPAGTSVLDVPVPASVLGPEFGGFTFLSRTVATTGLDLPLALGPRFVVPDESGRLHHVDLRPVSTLRPDQAFTAIGAPGVEHRNGCWIAGGEGALVWTPLSRPVGQGAWVLDLRHRHPSSAGVELVSAGVAPQKVIATGAATKDDDARWVLSSLPFAATQIGFQIPPHGRLCLARGTVDDVEQGP